MKYTIITVNYNNAMELSRTINNVLAQDYLDFEYIIIDGLSTDNSVEIAKSYIEKFAEKNVKYKIISEKDSGIYNAMNKGINYAQGDYINFMNAGDCFADSQVLYNVSKSIDNYDVFYGDTHVSKNGIIVRNDYAFSLDIINKCIPFCHQASFVKTNLAKAYKFNEKYKVQADYDMMLRLYLDGKTFKKSNEFIAIFEAGGISSAWNDEDNIIRRENGLPEYKRSKIKWILGKFVPQFIISWKHERVQKKKRFQVNDENNM